MISALCLSYWSCHTDQGDIMELSELFKRDLLNNLTFKKLKFTLPKFHLACMQEFTSSVDSFNSVLLKYTLVKEMIITIA